LVQQNQIHRASLKQLEFAFYNQNLSAKLATIRYSLLLQTKPLKTLDPVNMRFLGAKATDVLLCVHKLQNTDKKIVDLTRYIQYRV